jgi:hypothetical protein
MDKHEHQNIRLGIENASVGGLHGGDSQKVKDHTQQLSPDFNPNYGWLCPRCGRGNSPNTNTCLCMPFEMKVTC